MKQESALAAHEKIMADMRDEVAYLKEQEGTTIKVSCFFHGIVWT